MKSLSLLTLLAAGLALSGCVSDESSFGTVPGPSGSTTVASAAPASYAPEELPSGPPRDLSDNPPPPSEQPAATRPAPRPAPAQTRPNATKPVNKAPAKNPVQPAPSQSNVTPDSSLTAKVVTYNAVGRFVVLSFPVGQMARTEQSMAVYRNGVKVGELRITGPQRDNNIVADVVKGDARAGDEVRDR